MCVRRVRKGKELLIVRCIVRLPVSSQVERWKEQVTFHLFTPKLKQTLRNAKSVLLEKESSRTISRSLARVSFRGERKIPAGQKREVERPEVIRFPCKLIKLLCYFRPIRRCYWGGPDHPQNQFPAFCLICSFALVELAHPQAAPSGHI
jgi:hypothetical protein